MTTAIAPLKTRARQYGDFLAGKRCIVVGPAGYLQGQGRGEWIDSHDLVVKLNWGETLPADDYGRTDVLYKRFLKLGHADGILVQDYVDKGMQWLVGVGTGRDWQKGIAYLGEVIGDRLPWFVDTLIRNELQREFGTSPLLGMVVVKHLLAHDVESVAVIGCDFYQTGYASAYGGEQYRQYMKRGEGTLGRQHDGPVQLKWLAHTLATDKRLTVDDRLGALVTPAAPPKKRKKTVPAQPQARFEWTPLNVTTRRLPAMSLRTYIEQRDLRAILEPLGRLSHAAEIGAGFGRMTIVLQDHAERVTSFEREKGMAAIAQRLLPDVDVQRVEGLITLPGESGAFDFAMTFTVLQHMSHADVRRVTEELKRISSRYVLLVEDTDPSHVYIDRKDFAHFTLGRSVAEYRRLMAPFELIRVERREVERGFRYKRQPRSYVGHYMLFERRAA